MVTLPPFNAAGDLPPGVYCATMAEVEQRFMGATDQRALVTRRLRHIHEVAHRSGHVDRFIVFGSYVTNKSSPNDVDVVLVMDDHFRCEECPVECRGIFNHAIAQARFGASVFWIRPGLMIGETVEDFVAHWQQKRDGTLRGIVEVTNP
ncbi:MAG: hypothetical protein AUJ92_15610 [Armatimonadetes bacterium CG2_30_59_28]|nr:MAG: hypothetical protein AUJ92_15610 [Armatimonadetes bacterium CG2_30_59_28]PIU64476.1 MAG: hypothetical protein COS85_12360 [Armatimonadetes bacterium CG07_land_8_20_14_0_80_59_28]PJB68958.1 MAG: hypothetical protein CO095_10485 [Armatimonadetes bacterium CG_4_9_14_3_um_filter_58_7]